MQRAPHGGALGYLAYSPADARHQLAMDYYRGAFKTSALYTRSDCFVIREDISRFQDGAVNLLRSKPNISDATLACSAVMRTELANLTIDFAKFYRSDFSLDGCDN